MGRKYYVHPGAAVERGRARCTHCGAELPTDERGVPSLRTPFPCSVSLPTPFDEEVEVRVWDCRASVYVGGRRVDYGSLPRDAAEELERLAVESVRRAGGAINWSGLYPPCEELVAYVEELRRRGAL